jgi:hypothetical protein
MKPAPWLYCPACGGQLKLLEWEAATLSGIGICTACHVSVAFTVLLPPGMDPDGVVRQSQIGTMVVAAREVLALQPKQPREERN